MIRSEWKRQHQIHRLKRRYTALFKQERATSKSGGGKSMMAWFSAADALMTTAWCLDQLGELEGMPGDWGNMDRSDPDVGFPNIDNYNLQISWEDFPPEDVDRILVGDYTSRCGCLNCLLASGY